MLQVVNAGKAYGGQTVLKNFSISFPDKGTVCLFGPSGCGKTTLLRCIAGLEPLEKGCIKGLDGKRVSYIFQEDRLLPWATALENISVVLPKGRMQEAENWLGLAGLKDARDKKPAQLSGGMRQRVAIVRALAYGGDVLLMDEPFHALDEVMRCSMMKLIVKSMPKALKVLVTHRREEAEQMADVIYHLRGTPLQMVEQEITGI